MKLHRNNKGIWCTYIRRMLDQRRAVIQLSSLQPVAETMLAHLIVVIEYRRNDMMMPAATRSWLLKQEKSFHKQLVLNGIIDHSDIPGYGRTIREHVDDLIGRMTCGERWKTQKRNAFMAILDRMPKVTHPGHLNVDVVQAAILELSSDNDWSSNTHNKHVAFMRELGAFILKREAFPSGRNALADVPKVPEDQKRVYRTLSVDERTRLLNAALSDVGGSPPGYERFLIYSVAMDTGMRANELRLMQARHVRLDCEYPHIFVPASHNKAGRDMNKPLFDSRTVERLYHFINDELGLRADDPVFRFGCGTTMMARDMASADIPKETDAGTCVFHSLRHSFCHRLHRAKLGISDAMNAMGHQDANLTFKTYGRDSAIETAFQSMKDIKPTEFDEEQEGAMIIKHVEHKTNMDLGSLLMESLAS